MREGFTYTRREFLKKAGLAGGAMVMANVAGGIPSAAAATSKGQSAVDELLKGVCDIHIHAAPDVRERCINEFDFACKAKDLGYRAVMYKSNEWSCHDRAYLIRQALPDFEVFGSFCMNYTVGDRVNVHAAKMAAETTGNCCKCIWMPTMAAVYPNAVEGRRGQGIPVVQDGNRSWKSAPTTTSSLRRAIRRLRRACSWRPRPRKWAYINSSSPMSIP